MVTTALDNLDPESRNRDCPSCGHTAGSHGDATTNHDGYLTGHGGCTICDCWRSRIDVLLQLAVRRAGEQ